MPARASEPVSKAFRYTHSYFSERQRHSINTLPNQRPQPSHGDTDAFLSQDICKSKTGKLATLVGVEDSGFFLGRIVQAGAGNVEQIALPDNAKRGMTVLHHALPAGDAHRFPQALAKKSRSTVS